MITLATDHKHALSLASSQMSCKRTYKSPRFECIDRHQFKMVCKSITVLVFVALVVGYCVADQSSKDSTDARWAELKQHTFHKGPPVKTVITDREVYIRWPRPLQGRLEGLFENGDEHDSKANVN